MERMNERECEDKREREDENADGDAGLDALVSGANIPHGTVVLAATTSSQPKTPAVSMRSPTVSACM